MESPKQIVTLETFATVDWTTTVWCWNCERLGEFTQVKKKKFCRACWSQIAHGPRAALIAPRGRTLLAFDADALHYRIAATLSSDPFILDSLREYDRTGDPLWKPHVRNCAALFNISPEEAVGLMNSESNKYTFAKNFIYCLLNGGETPALANAAAGAGLNFSIPEVGSLLHNWLNAARGFAQWRVGLEKEAERTGSITLACGRRRRFYNLRMANGRWRVDRETRKEIYNAPLIGTEVTYVNPRLRRVYDWTVEHSDWMLVYHGHDGFMLEGPEAEGEEASRALIDLISYDYPITPSKVLHVPWAAKMGRCMAVLEKIQEA